VLVACTQGIVMLQGACSAGVGQVVGWARSGGWHGMCASKQAAAQHHAAQYLTTGCAVLCYMVPGVLLLCLLLLITSSAA